MSSGNTIDNDNKLIARLIGTKFDAMLALHNRLPELVRLSDFLTKLMTIYDNLGGIAAVEAALPELTALGGSVDTLVELHSLLEANLTAIQNAAQNAQDAKLAADIAKSFANFKGNFISGVTSALVGESYKYNNQFWLTLNNTTETPNISSTNWIISPATDSTSISYGSTSVKLALDALYTKNTNQDLNITNTVNSINLLKNSSLLPPVFTFTAGGLLTNKYQLVKDETTKSNFYYIGVHDFTEGSLEVAPETNPVGNPDWLSLSVFLHSMFNDVNDEGAHIAAAIKYKTSTVHSALEFISTDINELTNEIGDVSLSVNNIESVSSVNAENISSLQMQNTIQDSRIRAVEAGQGSGVIGYSTQTELFANLNFDDGYVGYVLNDTIATNNGTYRKSGASGTGSWIQSRQDLASQAYQLSSSNDSDLKFLRGAPTLSESESLFASMTLKAADILTIHFRTAQGTTAEIAGEYEMTGVKRSVKFSVPAITIETTLGAAVSYIDVLETPVGQYFNCHITIQTAVNCILTVGLYGYNEAYQLDILQDAVSHEFVAGQPKTINMRGAKSQADTSRVEAIFRVVDPSSITAISGSSLLVSAPWVYRGEPKVNNTSVRDFIAINDDSENRDIQTSFNNMFTDNILTGSPSIAASTLSTGWVESYRATPSYVHNTLFPAYSKMIELTVSDAGQPTRALWNIARSDINIVSLNITKSINVVSKIAASVDCRLKIFTYIFSSGGNFAKDEVFLDLVAGEVQNFSLESYLTADQITQMTSVGLYIHDVTSGTGTSVGDKIYLENINMFAEPSVKVLNLPIARGEIYQKPVDTWGDSITAEGAYQQVIASKLGVTVANYGIGSQFSQHIKDRFVAHYTANPSQLNNTMIIFMGTNNLLNTDSNGNGNDPLFTRLYAKSYKDQMLHDIKVMVDMIPHNRYLIVGGHVGSWALHTVEPWLSMDEADRFIQSTYQQNSLNIRHNTSALWGNLNIRVTSNFTKPALNGQLDIILNDVSFINANGNEGSFMVGTKDLYDTYRVDNVNGLTVTCTLTNDGGHFPVGHTMQAQYTLTATLGGDAVIDLRAYSDRDIWSYESENIPRSMTVDNIHPTANGYNLVGEILARRLIEL